MSREAASVMQRALLFQQFALCAAAAAYSEALATQYANLAGAAYCDPDSLKTWKCGAKCQPFNVTNVEICHGTATYSYIGLWDGRCLVGFEGSWDPKSWLQNLDLKEINSPWPACNDCQVHAGFVEEWFSHQGCVIDALTKIGCGTGSDLYSTGHSLGAAVNTFAMVSLEERGWHVAESYDFGRPRVGDHAFASFFDQQFAGRSWRVVNYRDPVPHMPVTDPAKLWHFWHTSPEVFYQSTGIAGGYQICSEPESDLNCSKQYEGPLFPFNIFYWHYHMSYMSGVPMYGALPFWARAVLQLPTSSCLDATSEDSMPVAQAVLV